MAQKRLILTPETPDFGSKIERKPNQRNLIEDFICAFFLLSIAVWF
jgi:hypothetical protein